MCASSPSGDGRLFFAALILGTVACAAGSPASAAPPTAGEILARAEAVRSPELDYAVDFRLEVVRERGALRKRSASYTMIAHGKDESLVVMREPHGFYPGTLLIRGAQYWLLLPRATKPYQLSPRHVLNGDISNGDLARGNLLRHYVPRLLGKETVRDERCWQLELEPSSRLAVYSRIRVWITRRQAYPWRFEYYGGTGSLLKVVDYDDYRETPLGIRSMRIEVENKVRVGEHTTLTFSELRPIDTSGLSYTPEGLQAFRDSALTRQERDGRQAELEELLDLVGTPGS